VHLFTASTILTLVPTRRCRDDRRAGAVVPHAFGDALRAFGTTSWSHDRHVDIGHPGA